MTVIPAGDDNSLLFNLYVQVIQDTFSRFTPFPNCRHHQIRTTHHVATGKHFWIAGLELVLLLLWRNHATPGIYFHTVGFKPRLWIGTETESDQHYVSWQNFFR